MANITNMTNVTNIVELIQYDNYSTGGLMGLGFLIMVWCVIFISCSGRFRFGASLTVASFATLVTSMFLQVLEIVSWEATALSSLLMVVGLVAAYLEGKT